MDDLKHEHGDEGTHSCCPEMLAERGGLAVCCECNNHECQKRPDEESQYIIENT